MKKVEKHRTDKRRRTRMTVRAFCFCSDPHNCVYSCPPDDAEFYEAMYKLYDDMFTQRA